MALLTVNEGNYQHIPWHYFVICVANKDYMSLKRFFWNTHLNLFFLIKLKWALSPVLEKFSFKGLPLHAKNVWWRNYKQQVAYKQLVFVFFCYWLIYFMITYQSVHLGVASDNHHLHKDHLPTARGHLSSCYHRGYRHS